MHKKPLQAGVTHTASWGLVRKCSRTLIPLLVGAFVLLAGGIAEAGVTDSIIYQYTGGNGNQAFFGRPTTFGDKNAIKYTAVSTNFVCYVDVSVRKSASPTDNVYVEFWTGGSDPNAEGGSLAITSALVSGATLPNIAPNYFNRFTFPNCILTGQGGIYYFVIKRTGALENTNYYQQEYTNSNADSNLKFLQYFDSNGVWSDFTRDTSIIIYGVSTGDMSAFSVPNLASTSNPFSPCGTTDFICQAGNAVYKLTTYLFVPNQAMLTGWTDLKNSVNVHIPFSYVNEVQTMISGATASSSAFPSFGMDLTPYGIQASVTFISLANVRHYLPDSLFNLFQNIIIYSLWLMFLLDVWQTVHALI